MRLGNIRATGIVAFSISLLAFGFTGQAIAQQITPTQVHQVVSAANNQLEALTQANMLAVPAPKNEEISPRRPRHVFQKSLTSYELLQTLRRLNGLSVNPMPDVPAHDLTPADVKALVDKMLTDTNALAALYGLPASAITETEEKRTPTDVYMALARYTQLITTLDMPPPLPNDVYRLANTIANVSTEIAQHYGLQDIPKNVAIDGGKSPGDVYRRGADLLDILRALNGFTGPINLPAGVIEPKLKTSGINPAIVNDLLGLVLADLIAAKKQIGVQTSTTLAPPVGGKTPSHVYERLETAHVILSKIY